MDGKIFIQVTLVSILSKKMKMFKTKFFSVLKNGKYYYFENQNNKYEFQYMKQDINFIDNILMLYIVDIIEQ